MFPNLKYYIIAVSAHVTSKQQVFSTLSTPRRCRNGFNKKRVRIVMTLTLLKEIVEAINQLPLRAIYQKTP